MWLLWVAGGQATASPQRRIPGARCRSTTGHPRNLCNSIVLRREKVQEA